MELINYIITKNSTTGLYALFFKKSENGFLPDFSEMELEGLLVGDNIELISVHPNNPISMTIVDNGIKIARLPQPISIVKIADDGVSLGVASLISIMT